MKLFTKVKYLILAIIFGFASIQAAEIKNSMDAILASGQQMSNMRKMLETYSLIATEVSYKSPDKRLKKSIEEYEGVLNDIDKNLQDDYMKESVKLSREAWAPVKIALLTALEDNDAKRLEEEGLFIHANIRSVIIQLANMKKHLLKKENIADSKMLNASIEIAASARRLSAHYMMRMWGLPDPTIEKHWNNGVKIYTDSIAILKGSKYYKNPEFKKLLDASNKHLKYFNTVWMFDDKFVPVIVQEKGDKAYHIANDMSKMILTEILK